MRLAQENSFEAIYQQWLAHRRLELHDRRQSTLGQMHRIFGKDILPKVGKLPIQEIKRLDLLGIPRKIETRGALTTAEKVRTWLNQLYRYALIVVDGLEHNPAADPDVVARSRPPVAHNPILSLRELPEFLRALRGPTVKNHHRPVGHPLYVPDDDQRPPHDEDVKDSRRSRDRTPTVRRPRSPG